MGEAVIGAIDGWGVASGWMERRAWEVCGQELMRARSVIVCL